MTDQAAALRAEIKTHIARILGSHLDRELAQADEADLVAFRDYIRTESERITKQRSPVKGADPNEALNKIIEKARQYKKGQ